MTEKSKKLGRPSIYTEELADEICNKIATSTVGKNVLCARYEHWPHPDTIRDWVIKKPSFSAKYAKAKQQQIEWLVEEALTVARTDDHDTIVTEDDVKCNHEWINRSRLHVDTIKWLASKLAPKIYGDEKQLNLEEQNAQLKEEMRVLREQLDAKNKKEY